MNLNIKGLRPPLILLSGTYLMKRESGGSIGHDAPEYTVRALPFSPLSDVTSTTAETA